jgi:hypothetical protein
MANNKNPRVSAGLSGESEKRRMRNVLRPTSTPDSQTHKFKFKFSAPQSSTTTEATMSTGIHNRLL